MGAGNSPTIRGMRRMVVRQARRDTIYKMKAKRNDGIVACFVCGEPVSKHDATLEHIVKQADGGTDDMENLDISHALCNHNRDRIEAERQLNNS